MLLLALIFLSSSSSLSDAASVIYKGAGDKVVILTGSDPGRITAITWKHNEDIAVEWYGGEPSAFRQFNGHVTLDLMTGTLTISNLTRSHSGSYTAEINNRIISTTEVRIISPVPKPTVSMRCDAEMTYCTLTCEGNTTDAGPFTFSWQIFDVHNYYEGQQINLTKDNPEPWYSCEMKNPISSDTSEEIPNPFSSGNRGLIIILVLFFLLLILGVLVGGIFICRRCNSRQGSFPVVKIHRSKTPKSNDQTGKEDKEADEQNTRLLEGSCNGVVVPAVSIEETSVQIPQMSSVVPDTNTQTAVLNINETSNPDKTSKKPDEEPENSPKKEEEIEVQDHKSETPESNNQTENSPEKEEIEVQVHKSENPEINNHTDESEESNGDQRPLLEQNHCISVSV